MAYRQVNDANWQIPYVGGLCEGYVEGGVGQATLPTVNNQITYGVYTTAMAAWYAEPNKHYDLPPIGKTVAVYFSLGNVPAGHVAWSLDDGMIASSTQAGFHTQGYLHPNLQDLINVYGKYNGGCKYLGWGEHVGHVRVVELASQNATATQVKALYLEVLERPADAPGLTHYAGNYTVDFIRNDMTKSEEYKLLLDKKVADAKAKADKIIADAIAHNAEVDRIEALRLAAEAKVRQDAIDAENARIAKEASDKAIADAKLATEAELAKQAVDNNKFILVLRELWNIIWAFFVQKGKQ